MLTYDNHQFVEPTLDDLVVSHLPDLIDVGENNEFWIRVSRRLKKVEIVSKQSGMLVARCLVEDAADFGFGPAVIGAARQAMELGK